MLDDTAFSRRLEVRIPRVGDTKPTPPSEAGSNRAPTSADGSVGRRIKEIRRSQHLSQKQLAARVGVTGAQLHRYEVGSTRVATSRLMAIAAALGVPPQRLISDVAPSPVAMEPIYEAAPPGDLVELVELYSSLSDPRRRNAMVAFARSLAAPSTFVQPREG